MIGNKVLRTVLLLGVTVYGGSGCVSGKTPAPEIAEPLEAADAGQGEVAPAVRVEAQVSNPASTVTTEGAAVRRIMECEPLADVARPSGPSVEIGVAAPLPQRATNVVGEGVHLYTRYHCN